MKRLLVCSLALCAAVGCHRGAGRPVQDAGAVVDAGPPPPPEFAVTLRMADADGGTTSVPLVAGDTTSLEPAPALHFHANRVLRNVRLRLFDEGDRVLPSDDVQSDGPEGTAYDVVLATPLKAGRKYTLVLDAQTGETFADSLGGVFQEQRYALQTTGEREKDAPPAVPKGKIRRRRQRG